MKARKEAGYTEMGKKRDETVELWYRNRYLDIYNLKAKVCKIKREIEEFKPEELEVKFKEDISSTFVSTSSLGSMTLGC